MYRELTITVENDKYYVEAFVGVVYEHVDDSFDHDLGYERRYHYEPVEVVIIDVTMVDTKEKLKYITQELRDLIKQEAFKEEF